MVKYWGKLGKMENFPRIRADGDNLEIELEAGLVIVSHVGDPILVQAVERVWSERESVAEGIARLTDLLAGDEGHLVDDCVIPLLRGLPQHAVDAVPVPSGER
ncbi:hypothetical protein [Chelatococcus asaccharovorans]|uniref:Uncharacterized protein n=2 Tax=Chelatococcus asaccharovorans TaxID=28210 RepID=A0A2V3TPW7_9HYPH|nr:hypothetical protein [Chelatococcus asaccharovorans]PXW50060.1 hypothetical protein C7450_1333 [Chelatococcus asaccharovorans]CAH1672831.1 conserved hypothetical protein [Chelatococcus asaccharovorans]CAH1675754.1 conserved hypothetical protein [Chelatococcus asaccharovorans]